MLNQPIYKDATILLARKNFGCGSSREHAPWALQQHGFKAVIAPSFGDIFYNNSLKNGFLPIVLLDFQVDHLFTEVAAHPGFKLTIDVPAQTVTAPNSKPFSLRHRSIAQGVPGQRLGRNRIDPSPFRRDQGLRGQAQALRALDLLVTLL